MLDASRESLLIYWLHLVIIYSAMWGKKNLADIIGPNLNVWESIVVTIVLMVLMVLVAILWSRTKMKFPNYATKFAWGAVGVLFIIFLLS